MKNQVVFFSIPTSNFDRAVKFYTNVLDCQITVCPCEGSSEIMGMMDVEGTPGCIFYHDKFKPSADGTQISFTVPDMDATLAKVRANGGKVIWEKTEIQAEGQGYCGLFSDSEGNTIGLHSRG